MGAGFAARAWPAARAIAALAEHRRSRRAFCRVAAAQFLRRAKLAPIRTTAAAGGRGDTTDRRAGGGVCLSRQLSVARRFFAAPPAVFFDDWGGIPRPRSDPAGRRPGLVAEQDEHSSVP